MSEFLNESVCRLCFTSDAQLLEIFSPQCVSMFEGEGVASVLTKHFWFDVIQNDSFSQLICVSCWTSVEIFHELYTIVEQKYKTFFAVENPDNAQKIHNEVEHIDIKLESPFVADSQPCPHDDNTADVSDCDMRLSDPVCEQADDQERISEDNSDEYAPKKTRSRRLAKTVAKESRSAKRQKGKTVTVDPQPNDDPGDSPPIKVAKKLRIEAVKNNALVRRHFKMCCDICDVPYDTFVDAKKHHLDVHKQKGYLMCCEKKFSKLYSVLQHCKWHDNPQAFQCPKCTKSFSGSSGLRDHLHSVHASADEKTFLCDLCPKSFALEYMLTKHKRMQHISDADKKFSCDICGQRFILYTFVKAHIKKVHENADSRMCDICAKFFKCSKSYELHYISVHTNIQQKVRCELCKKWLKHEYGLKEHMRRHSASNEKCQFCGRISANKKALRAHIRTVHGDPAYRCTICEKMFKRTKTLKEHMAIHSGRTDLYTCTFCPKTFRSSANMYSHRKRSHPTEYEENKVHGSKYAQLVAAEAASF